jgi:hypothetical protein
MPRAPQARLVVCLLLTVITIPSGLALAATHPDPVPGTLGVRLVPPSGAPSGNPLARSYVVARVAPGAHLTRQVEISNTTDRTMSVTAYVAAASMDEGGFSFAEGHTQNDVAFWTHVSRPLIRIAAGATSIEEVMIRVPRHATAGTGYAVIWAEASAAAPADGGVRLVNRVGIRVYLTVGDGVSATPMFTLSGLHAERSGGEPLIVAIVHNTGATTLAVAGEVSLADGPDGLRAGPFEVTPGGPIAPGGSESVSARIGSSLPLGAWHARMVVRSGGLTRSVAATVSFPAAETARPGAADGRQGWTAVAALVLLALLAIAGRWQLRRVRAARPLAGL